MKPRNRSAFVKFLASPFSVLLFVIVLSLLVPASWRMYNKRLDVETRLGDSVRRYGTPVVFIAGFNSKGVLKSKDNPLYRWCCYWTLYTLPRVI